MPTVTNNYGGETTWRLNVVNTGNEAAIDRQDIDATLPAQYELSTAVISQTADGIIMDPQAGASAPAITLNSNEYFNMVLLNDNTDAERKLTFGFRWEQTGAEMTTIGLNKKLFYIVDRLKAATSTTYHAAGWMIGTTGYNAQRLTFNRYRHYNNSNYTIDTTNAIDVPIPANGDWIRIEASVTLPSGIGGNNVNHILSVYNTGATYASTGGTQMGTTQTSAYNTVDHDEANLYYGFGWCAPNAGVTTKVRLGSIVAEAYTVPSITVNSSFPASPNVPKTAEEIIPSKIDFSRAGNTNSFALSTNGAVPTGITATIVSDFGTGSAAIVGWEADATASLGSNVVNLRATDGSVNVDLAVTLNVVAAPGAAGSPSYVASYPLKPIVKGSSTFDYMAAAGLSTKLTSRFGGTNAWTPPTYLGTSNGEHGHATTSVIGQWGWYTNDAFEQTMIQNAFATNFNSRLIVGCPPYSNAWATAAATVQAAVLDVTQKELNVGLSWLAFEAGVRPGGSVATGTTKNVSHTSTTITCEGGTLSGVSGTYTSAHRLMVEYSSGVGEFRKISSYTVSGTDRIFNFVGDPFVESASMNSTVKNVTVMLSNQSDAMEVMNAWMKTLATPGHANYIENTTFGTRVYYVEGWYEKSKRYQDLASSPHVTATGHDIFAQDVTDAIADWALSQGVVTITPTNPSVVTNATEAFSKSLATPSYFNSANWPGDLISAAGGNWAMVSGGGSINSSTGDYTAPASTGTDVIRWLYGYGPMARTENTITVTAGGGLTAGTLTEVSVTSTTANLTATDATGGTGPYTYQWYRDTNSGFTPGPGTLLAGKTSLTLADTGLTANTTYYYKVRYTDATLTGVNSSQEAVTTRLAAPTVAVTFSAANTVSVAATLGGVTQFDYDHNGTVTTNVTSPQTYNVTDGTTEHKWRVRANSGPGDWSAYYNLGGSSGAAPGSVMTLADTGETILVLSANIAERVG